MALIKIVDTEQVFVGAEAEGVCEGCSYPDGYEADPVEVPGFEVEEAGDEEAWFLCRCSLEHGSAVIVAA